MIHLLEKIYCLCNLYDCSANFQFAFTPKDIFTNNVCDNPQNIQSRYLAIALQYRLEHKPDGQVLEYWLQIWTEFDTLLAWIVFERNTALFSKVAPVIFQAFTILKLQNQETDYLNKEQAGILASVVEKSERLVTFLKIVLERINRQISIEIFEQALDGLFQSQIDNPLIKSIMMRYAFWTAYVYYHEYVDEQRSKCRPWFEKAIQWSSNSVSRVVIIWPLIYSVKTVKADKLFELEKRITTTKEHIYNHPDRGKSFWTDAPNQLWINFLLIKCSFVDAAKEKKQVIDELIAYTNRRFEIACHNQDAVSTLELGFTILEIIFSTEPYTAQFTNEDKGFNNIEWLSYVGQKLAVFNNPSSDYYEKYHLWLTKRNICLSWLQKQNKEGLIAAKEYLQNLRKTPDSRERIEEYPPALMLYLVLESQKVKAQQPIERLNESIKWCFKRMNEDGWRILLRILYLFTSLEGIRKNNIAKNLSNNHSKNVNKNTNNGFQSLFKTGYPAISILRAEYAKQIQEFFDLLAQVHQWALINFEQIGSHDWQLYQLIYLKLQPLAQCDIHTYFRYFNLSLDIWHIQALIHEDFVGAEFAQKIIHEMRMPFNPFQQILTAEWTDFKQFTDKFHNSILNRSISIQKGDVLEASKMASISYRNLRNYVTQGDVNRLGYFLEELTTTARSLEMGLRLLLADDSVGKLSFDTLFDLPAFLIGLEGKAFTAQDLAQHFNISINTAHKHVNRLTELRILKYVAPQVLVSQKIQRLTSAINTKTERQNHYILHIENLQERYLLHKEELEMQKQIKTHTQDTAEQKKTELKKIKTTLKKI